MLSDPTLNDQSLSASQERRVYNNIIETIGNTPLIRLNSVARDLKTTLWAKVEYFNPGGSVKDRIGPAIIDDAEQSGRLKPGGTIVESTSGNTGIGLAITAALRGYKTIFVMPDKQSQEKIQLLKAYGARVVVTPTAVEPEDPRSYYSVAKRLVDETPNAILANQYHNPANPQAHVVSTGPELWEQTNGKITHFIVGMGTGGTISGVGQYLKEKNPDIQIIGVDPYGSILYDLHKTGEWVKAESYKLEGIGEDFLPSTTNLDIIDDIVRVNDKESFIMTRRLVREEGMFIGGSCGAAVAGALRYIREHNLGPDAVPVVLLPDSGSRYLSKIFNDDWMRENGYLQSEWSDVRASDVHGSKANGTLIKAQPHDKQRDVIAVLKEHDISQVPVVDENGHLQGIVTELDLLNHVLLGDHDHSPNETIEPLIRRNVPLVRPNLPLEALMAIFSDNDVVLLATEQNVEGILTKIDMLDFLSSRM